MTEKQYECRLIAKVKCKYVFKTYIKEISGLCVERKFNHYLQ